MPHAFAALRPGLALALAVLLLALAGCASPGIGSRPAIVMEEFRVPSDPGLEIYVRNKRRADMTRFAAAKTVVFLHGATYPSETAFDLQVGGFSWMDYIAERGYDVYLMDVRGYGRSTRPPQMDRPPAENPPFGGAEEAMRDLDAVIEFVRKRRGVERVNILAWSWGTAVAQWYATRQPAKVEKLALYAPLWIRQTASLVQAGPGPLGAYRTANMQQAKQRWLNGVPEAKKETLIPAGWYEAWSAATLASDPEAAKRNPPVIRAPNGSVADSQKYWGAGVIPWKAGDIRAPVLLVKAEWDADTPAYMAQTLFPLLTGAPWKRYVEIGEGTHTVILEKNRLALFRAVQAFLDEEHVPER